MKINITRFIVGRKYKNSTFFDFRAKYLVLRYFYKFQRLIAGLFDETGYALCPSLAGGLTQNLAVDEGGARRGRITEGSSCAAARDP